MTPDEQAQYRAAIEPWVRRAARERKVISYVHYRPGGQLDAILSPKPRAAPQVEDTPSSRSLLL